MFLKQVHLLSGEDKNSNEINKFYLYLTVRSRGIQTGLVNSRETVSESAPFCKNSKIKSVQKQQSMRKQPISSTHQSFSLHELLLLKNSKSIKK